MNSQITKEFCKKLPKIELHAHLNGCVRKSTLKQLAIQYNLEEEFSKIVELKKKDIDQAFQIFDIIYKVVFELENIKKITAEMIQDFQNDNVIYLEIRTTPKEIEGKYTQEKYIETIINVIKQFEKNPLNTITVRLLLCVDRGKPLNQAENLLNMLKKIKSDKQMSKYIVGVDLCGNPYKNKFQIFKRVFQSIRDLKLKTTIHAGELDGPSFIEETKEILDFVPDRIGHFNYFNNDLYDEMIKLKIPIEMCPTSNLFTLKLKDYSEHHFKQFFEKQHPICICTDGLNLLVFAKDVNRYRCL